MAKLPYIKFYPGDWERDANCLTSNAEYGLFRLMLKLSDSDTRGCIKTSFRTLSVIFKSNIKVAKEIISELMDNNILNIKINSDSDIEIVSRRLTKEAQISDVRSESGKKSAETKLQQNLNKNLNKNPTKPQQNPEYEYEYDNEDNNKLESSREEKNRKSIMLYFAFTESANPDKQSLIFQFLKCLHLNNKLEYFEIQFPAYCEYKRINGYKHKFNNFIGDQSEKYLNGGWNAENWVEKLKEITKQQPEKPVYVAPKKGITHTSLPTQ